MVALRLRRSDLNIPRRALSDLNDA